MAVKITANLNPLKPQTQTLHHGALCFSVFVFSAALVPAFTFSSDCLQAPEVFRLCSNSGRSPWMVEHLLCTIGCRVAAIDEWLLTG